VRCIGQSGDSLFLPDVLRSLQLELGLTTDREPLTDFRQFAERISRSLPSDTQLIIVLTNIDQLLTSATPLQDLRPPGNVALVLTCGAAGIPAIRTPGLPKSWRILDPDWQGQAEDVFLSCWFARLEEQFPQDLISRTVGVLVSSPMGVAVEDLEACLRTLLPDDCLQHLAAFLSCLGPLLIRRTIDCLPGIVWSGAALGAGVLRYGQPSASVLDHIAQMAVTRLRESLQSTSINQDPAALYWIVRYFALVLRSRIFTSDALYLSSSFLILICRIFDVLYGYDRSCRFHAHVELMSTFPEIERLRNCYVLSLSGFFFDTFFVIL
jgi:hypothetical protein